MQKVIIPNTVNNIGEFAFSYCGSLEKITIPSSVTNIETYAFLDCNNLTITVDKKEEDCADYNAGWDIEIPVIYKTEEQEDAKYFKYTLNSETKTATISEMNSDSYKTFIEPYGFGGFNGVYAVSSTFYGNVLYNTSSGVVKKNLTFPKTIIDQGETYTVTKIGSGVFSFPNFSLCFINSITIPDTVTTIEDFALRNVTPETLKTTNINIPSSIQNIGSSAFPYDCIINIDLTEEECNSRFSSGWNNGATVNYKK